VAKELALNQVDQRRQPAAEKNDLGASLRRDHYFQAGIAVIQVAVRREDLPGYAVA
jgi:hypothetical protein